MKAENSKLLKAWCEASKDIGFNIEAPFTLLFKSGHKIKVNFLISNPKKNDDKYKGMLIVTDYSLVSPYINEITKLGYGFSTLSEPTEDRIYNRDSFIDVLEDWGLIDDN